MRNNNILDKLTVRLFGIIFFVLGISGLIYCFQNYGTDAVTIGNCISSIILAIGGIGHVIAS